MTEVGVRPSHHAWAPHAPECVCVVEAGVTVLVLPVVTKNSESQKNPLALHPASLQSEHVWTSDKNAFETRTGTRTML